jgi:hypothetical protein
VKGAAFLSVVAVWGAVSGCADPPPVASVESFCDGVCRGAARCDSRVSWRVCFNGCLTEPQNRSLDTVRPEAAAVVGACLSELDCPTIFNGPFDACWERAREESTPSAHLLAFCPPYATSAFECGYWFSVEECQARLNIWTDEFLDALAACTQEATCEATDACLESRFGGT